jgi:hypothetical protein
MDGRKMFRTIASAEDFLPPIFLPICLDHGRRRSAIGPRRRLAAGVFEARTMSAVMWSFRVVVRERPRMVQ